ncbi:MAG: rod shape-determining protein MreC [Gammaproteobacteria bacterium]
MKGPSIGIKLLAFIALSVVLMTVDHKHGHLEKMRGLIATLVYPVQYAVGLPVEMTRNLSRVVLTRKKLLQENERLRLERLKLDSRLQRFSVLEAENERLRALLESSVNLSEKVLVAELMDVDLQPFRQQVIIDKGSIDAAYLGQPVIDAGGIMGQIIHIAPFSSTVLLITDPIHSIPVQVNRNGLRAIAVGTGQDNVLLLEHLPVNADIKEGDLIVSSGLGRRFPRGYPVGRISRVSHIPGEPFSEVMVIPSAKPGQSTEVLLVWPYEEQAREDDAAGMVMN